MRICITGDSHTAALARACDEWFSGGELVAGMLTSGPRLQGEEPFYEMRDGKVFITPAESRERLEQLLGRDYLERDDGLLGLCMGLNAAWVFREPAWRHCAPWTIAEATGLQPASSAALDSFFAHVSWQVFGFFDALARCGVRFFVLAGPPARRGHPCMASGTQPRVALEVIRLYRAFVRRYLDERGYPLIDFPESSLDDDGFLKAEFEQQQSATGSRQDNLHATPAYGKLYLDKVMAELPRHFG